MRCFSRPAASLSRNLVVLSLLLAAAPAPGVPPAAGDGAAQITVALVQAKLDEVQASTELAEETRTKLVEIYRKTITQLEAAATQRETAARFKAAAETATADSARKRRELETKTKQPVDPGVASSAPLEQLEAALLKEMANRAAIEAKLAEIETQSGAEAGRPVAVRDRLAEAKRQMAEIAAEVERRPPPATAEDVARGWLLDARRAALAAEVRALDEELLSQPLRLDLLAAERDLVALTLERSQSRVLDLEALVLEQRKLATEATTAEAEAALRDLEGKHPLVQEFAQRNATLAEEIVELTERLERATGVEGKARKLQGQVEEDFRNAKQKLEIAGLSQALGMVLDEQRRGLPDVSKTRKQVAAREQVIAEATLRQIQYREERRALGSPQAFVAEAIARLPREEAALVDDALRAELEDWARKRRTLLDQALEIDQTYIRTLGELDFAQRGLIDTVTAFDSYLAGRLLWIRTAPALTLADVAAIPREVATVLAPARWAEVGSAIVGQLTGSPAFVLGLLLWAALLAGRMRIKAALRATGRHVGEPTVDDIAATVRAVALTVLLALPWPLLLGLLAWQIGAAPQSTEFVRAVVISLEWALRLLAPLEFFRCVCVPGGLAEIHFNWTAFTRQTLRRNLARLMLGFLSFGFVVALLVNFKQVALTGGLGRAALLGTIIAVGVFAWGMLHPETGALRGHLGESSGGWLSRLRNAWYALAIGVLVLLGGLTVAGYYYAAAALLTRAVLSVTIVFAVVIVHELLVRWMMLTQRRLAYRDALERREAARQAREKAQREGAPLPEAVPVLNEVPEVDFVALGAETQKLLDTMLWIGGVLGLAMVWWVVLPALDVLNDITLWTRIGTVGGEEAVVPVTLADVLGAVVLAFVAVVATRSLPAFLQFAVLQRVGVAPGSQYAITTLSSYAVGALGFVAVTNRIGIDWSQLQWLVAALGVGIGFGLQEIVANFISGLILLFERPVRVGDVVTVGTTDGVVTKIQIRATTIRTWDRKELLVPNKEFVTGRLLNWSLSDQISRLTVTVGVAYGSDVGRAMTLMTEIAKQHPRVMREPAPFVAFEGFAESTLTLNLRCFVESLDYRLSTISELHFEINRRFQDEGIEIALPQRDFNLKPTSPLEVRLVEGRGPSA